MRWGEHLPCTVVGEISDSAEEIPGDWAEAHPVEGRGNRYRQDMEGGRMGVLTLTLVAKGGIIAVCGLVESLILILNRTI